MNSSRLSTPQRWLAALDWSRLPGAVWNWAIILVGLLLAQGLGSIVAVVVARRVVPIDFGQYLACISLASLLVVFPAFGMDNWLLAQASAGSAEIAALWRAALRVRLALLAAWLVAMLALDAGLPPATYPLHILLPVALLVGAESVVALAFSALRLRSLHRRVTILQSIFGAATLTIAVLLPLFPNRLFVFAAGSALVAVATAVAVVVVANRLLRQTGPAKTSGPLFRAARSFMLGDLAVLVYSRVTLTLVSLLVGAAGVAAFGPADSLISASFWVPVALYYLALPALSRAHGANRRGDYARVGLAQLAAQAVTGLALSAAIFLLAPLMIRWIFGSAYDAAIPILQWTSPIPFFKALNFGLGAWLTGSQRQSDRTGIQIVVAIFTVVAGIAAIGRWGLAGAAAIEVANEALLTFGYTLITLWRWRQPPVII
jgi:O-antigen/teichoic acid export membrane protein